MENGDNQETTNIITEISISDGKLPECIESLFKWSPHQFSPHETSEDMVIRLLEKDEEIISDTDFSWRSFIIQLVLCYELHRQNKHKESVAKIKECEAILKNEAEMSYDILYKSITQALWHVTLACKAYLMLESGLMTEVKQALKAMTPLTSMDKPNLAGIYGIKAAVIMEYGFSGNKESVEIAKMAIKEDPKQAEWHFLFGKSLATSRRVYEYFESIKEAELKALKEAVNIATLNSQRPFRYMLYLGHVYRECAFSIYKANAEDKTYRHSNAAEVNEKLNYKARNIYKTIMQHQKDNGRSIARCCFGLMKIPSKFLDCSLIEQALERAVKLLPNNMMILHVCAMFFERIKEDFTNALKYYKMSSELGCFGAWHNFIKLKYHIVGNYNPMEDYSKVLEKFKATPRRHHTLCQISAYYLVQKKNVFRAIHYFMIVLKENPSQHVLMLKINFVSMYDPVHFMKVLTQEVQFVLATKIGELESDEKKNLRQFIMRVACFDSSLLSDTRSSSVEDIIKKSKEIQLTTNNHRKKQRSYKKMKKKLLTRGTEKIKDDKTKKNKKNKKVTNVQNNLEREEALLRWNLVRTGLPLDVAKNIKQLGLQKEIVHFRGRSLSESQIDKIDVSSNESFYKRLREKMYKLVKSVSVDVLPLQSKNKKLTLNSTGYDSDASQSVISASDTELSWRLSKGGDRDFQKGWKRTNSVSSVDSDSENTQKARNKECTKKTEENLPWRSAGGENRFFGKSNIMKRGSISDVDSDSENIRTSLNKERTIEPEGNVSWRSAGGENRFFGRSNVMKRGSVSDVDSDSETTRSARNECRKKPEENVSWRSSRGENRAFGDSHINSGNQSTRSSADSNQGKGLKWYRGRTDSTNSFDSEYESHERNLMEKPTQSSKDLSHVGSKVLDQQESKVNRESAGQHARINRARSFGEYHYDKDQKEVGDESRGNLRNDKHQFERYYGGSARARSCSMSSDSMQNFFEPSFKTNPIKGKESFSGEKARTNLNRKESEGQEKNTKASKSDVSWGNSRWVSENKMEIKQITSAKAKMQVVIREPRGPDENKKGFTFARRSCN